MRSLYRHDPRRPRLTLTHPNERVADKVITQKISSPRGEPLISMYRTFFLK